MNERAFPVTCAGCAWTGFMKYGDAQTHGMYDGGRRVSKPEGIHKISPCPRCGSAYGRRTDVLD